MSTKVYINGITRPLLDDLRFALHDYFPEGSVLFDMNTTPPAEVKLCTQPGEVGVTQRKLLPNGRYGVFIRERGRMYYPSVPVCVYVLNLPPTARPEMLFQLFQRLGFEVQKADIFRSADEECNGRGLVVLQQPNQMGKLPSVIEFPLEFPDHILRVELSRELPKEHNMPVAENGFFDNSLEASTPVKSTGKPTNGYHYGQTPISGGSSTPSRAIIRSPHPELLSGVASANGRKKLPMRGHMSSAVGGKMIANGMIAADPRGTTQSVKFFVVHLTREEAEEAVKNDCFYPRFPPDALFLERVEEVEIIFTVERNTLFFGIARLLTRQRQDRCMISWICSHVYAPIHEPGDSLGPSGSELPAALGERLCLCIRNYCEEAMHSPSDRHSDSYGSPISYVSGGPHSPYGGEQRFPVNQRGRARGRGHHQNIGPYSSVRSGITGSREPRPIGEEMSGEYLSHHRPYSP